MLKSPLTSVLIDKIGRNLNYYLWWDSEEIWHLKPFWSRHCFWHIWQYHRNFWSPLLFILFASHFEDPFSAFTLPILLCLLTSFLYCCCFFNLPKIGGKRFLSLILIQFLAFWFLIFLLFVIVVQLVFLKILINTFNDFA